MAKIIPLSNGKFGATVDDDDYDRLTTLYKWHPNVFREDYIHAQTTVRVDGRRTTLLMSREIWIHHNGPIPPGLTVDHKEHGKHGALDNRKCNLQLATRSQQCLNTRKAQNCISRYRYVTRSGSGKWVAQIGRTDQYWYLGSYEREIEAAIQADRASYILFGDAVRLNFPELKEDWKGLTMADLPQTKKYKTKKSMELAI